jgi:ADP-ribose 1''-phosphate phosphatase
MIKYSKKSLFNAPKDTLLVHACNAQGVWGSGIAKEFKEKFPLAYEDYNDFCTVKAVSVGNALICDDKVVCLLTSRSYGKDVDKPGTILVNTVLALNDLLNDNMTRECWLGRKFASNKFNSGLFNVPWEQTEQILNHFVEKYNLDWTVYTGEE